MHNMEDIWTMVMETHFLHVLGANLKIDAIYTSYSERFCGKNHAIREMFIFSDSEGGGAGGTSPDKKFR